MLFDVDGTLYHQAPLRLCMGLELAVLPLRSSPASARRTWSAISAFRRVREELRDPGVAEAPLARLQFERAAERVGMEVDEVEAVVSEWIFRRPLRYLRRCRRAGIESLLDALAARGVPAGVFSDYPAREKLEALGLSDRISLVACATDAEINAFKPDPRGFAWCCERWGLEPSRVLYVGDRVEVDARGAANAGMPCAILSRRLAVAPEGMPTTPVPSYAYPFTRYSSFADLQQAIDAGD